MQRYILPILSFYLDFIVVSTIVSLAAFFLGSAWSMVAGEEGRWYVEYGVTLALLLLGRKLGLSVGDRLLQPAREMAGETPRPRLWPNLLLGTFLLLDGLKQMLRWSQLDAVLPVFGMVETTPLKIVALLALGGLFVVAGGMILRFARGARALAATALAVATASLGLSWSVLPEALARAQIAHRAAQGMPIRDGEIEAVQAMMPWVTAGGLAVLLALPLLTRER